MVAGLLQFKIQQIEKPCLFVGLEALWDLGTLSQFSKSSQLSQFAVFFSRLINFLLTVWLNME